MEQPVTSAG